MVLDLTLTGVFYFGIASILALVALMKLTDIILNN